MKYERPFDGNDALFRAREEDDRVDHKSRAKNTLISAVLGVEGVGIQGAARRDGDRRG